MLRQPGDILVAVATTPESLRLWSTGKEYSRRG